MGGWSLASNPLFGSTGSFWAPILGAVAVFGAVSLFLVSLMTLLMGAGNGEHAKKLTAWTGLSFFALTVGGPLFVGTLIGFVLTWFGVGGELKM